MSSMPSKKLVYAATIVPSEVHKWQYHQVICVVKSHCRALATFQIEYCVNIA